MTQQEQQPPPAWAWLAIIVVPLVFVVASITAITIPTVFDRILDISLGAGGIAIGLIIYFYQNKQGKEIHDQGRRIGNVVTQVDQQTNNTAAMLNEVRTMNADVRAMITEIMVRADRRRNLHVGHITNLTDLIRNRMVGRAADRIEAFLQGRDATFERWGQITTNMQQITDQVQGIRTAVNAHFLAIEDLLMNPGLGGIFDADLLAMSHLLLQIRHIRDPINDFDDRREPIESLQELRARLDGLGELLRLLRREVQ